MARADGPDVRAGSVGRVAGVDERAPLRGSVGLAVVRQDLPDGHLTGEDVVVAEGELLRDRPGELRVRLGVPGAPGGNVVFGETVIDTLGLVRDAQSVVVHLLRVGVVKEVVVRVPQTRGPRS